MTSFFVPKINSTITRATILYFFHTNVKNIIFYKEIIFYSSGTKHFANPCPSFYVMLKKSPPHILFDDFIPHKYD
jgi:hypothetical protein